ncbi:hypothetical protein [Sporomusa acidovorans]|uniref:hypothetical protein n=1 Tax=Sporomusa acidovorans TaxID=112900 RepID=UPI000B866A35|nr:hypothetical protein [Sporomusa acidovorans]
MRQYSKCQYVPKNWPVDSVDDFGPIRKKTPCFTNIALPVTPLPYLEGCFKARQMACFGKKCWL